MAWSTLYQVNTGVLLTNRDYAMFGLMASSQFFGSCRYATEQQLMLPQTKGRK